MPLALGAVADDYTGASDLANTFAKEGLRTVQTIGVPADDLALPEIDAIVVALKTRSIAAADAIAQARRAERWLRARGAGHVLFKICSTFDSTDAGNIGPVSEALRGDAGGGLVLVTPAFPETGRTVFRGHLFVGAQRLDESPLKDHPLNPMRDSSLVRVLQRQSRGPVGLIALETVEAGPAAVRAEAARLAASGVAMAIADTVFERNLETVGAVALDGPLSTGASGLGLGLARGLVRAGRVRAGARHAGGDAVANAVGGHAAIVAGSCSQATLGQIAAAEGTIATLRLDPERLVTQPEAADEAVVWAHARLAAGPVLLASSAPPAQVAALQQRHGGAVAGHAIEQALARIAAALVQAGVRRLVVAGGETSGAVVDRLAIPAFLIEREIAPGVPILRAVGGPAGMLMALKSGNFGGVSFFTDALAMMR
jgi:uncharacterized protein YgbK (DUF1537 family)